MHPFLVSVVRKLLRIVDDAVQLLVEEWKQRQVRSVDFRVKTCSLIIKRLDVIHEIYSFVCRYKEIAGRRRG